MKNLFKLITIVMICFIANIAYSQATLKLKKIGDNWKFIVSTATNPIAMESGVSNKAALLTAKNNLLAKIRTHNHSTAEVINNALIITIQEDGIALKTLGGNPAFVTQPEEWLRQMLGDIPTTVTYDGSEDTDGDDGTRYDKDVDLALVEIDRLKNLWRYEVRIKKYGENESTYFVSQMLAKHILLQAKDELYNNLKNHIYTSVISKKTVIGIGKTVTYEIKYRLKFSASGVDIAGELDQTKKDGTAEDALYQKKGSITQPINFKEYTSNTILDYSILTLEQEKKNVNQWKFKLYGDNNVLMASSAIFTKEICQSEKDNLQKIIIQRIYKKEKTGKNDTTVVFTSGKIVLKWLAQGPSYSNVAQKLDGFLTNITLYSFIIKDARATLTLRKQTNSNNYYYEIKDRYDEVVATSTAGTKSNLLLHKVKLMDIVKNQTWESVTWKGFTPNEKMNITLYGTKPNSLLCSTSDIKVIPDYPTIPDEWLKWKFGEKPIVVTYIEKQEIEAKIAGFSDSPSKAIVPIITTFVIKTEGASPDIVAINFKPFGNRFTIQSSIGKFKKEYILDNKTDTTLQIPKGIKDWKIYCLDSDDKMTIASQFSTETAERDNGINISKKMFNDISGYLRKTNGQTLYQFVVSKQDVSYYEKVHFVQRYFLKDKAIPVAYLTTKTLPTEAQAKAMLPNGANGNNLGRGNNECDCEFLVTTTESVSKGEIEDCGKIQPEVQIVNTASENGKSTVSGRLEATGSAKKMNMSSNGKRTHSYSGEWDLSESDEVIYGENQEPNEELKTAYSSQLAYNYLCTNQDYLPDNCADCYKNVNVWAKYETKIETKANTEQCFLCGNKGSNAAAEDMAVVTVSSPFTDTLPKIISARRAGGVSECSMEINKDFAMSLVDFAGTVSSAILVYSSAGIIDTTGVTPLASIAATII